MEFVGVGGLQPPAKPPRWIRPWTNRRGCADEVVEEEREDDKKDACQDDNVVEHPEVVDGTQLDLERHEESNEGIIRRRDVEDERHDQYGVGDLTFPLWKVAHITKQQAHSVTTEEHSDNKNGCLR